MCYFSQVLIATLVQVTPATSDSNVGNADAIKSAFNFLNVFSQSEPNAASGTQNPSFYALLTADTQLKINMGDAARDLTVYVVDGNSEATGQVVSYWCILKCHLIDVIPVCKIECKL